MYSNGGKRKRIYSSKYALGSICTCTRVEHGPDACDAPTIGEEELHQATVKAINLLVRCSSSMMIVLLENIEAAIIDDNSDELEILNELLTAKQKELVKLAQAKKDYSAFANGFERLKEKKQKLLVAKLILRDLKREFRSWKST